MPERDGLYEALARWRGDVLAPCEPPEPRFDTHSNRLRTRDPGALTSHVQQGLAVVCTAFGPASLLAVNSFLALWRAGYAVAPLDVRLTALELAKRIRVVRPALLFADRRHEKLMWASIEMAGPPVPQLIISVPTRPTFDALPSRSSGPGDAGLVVFTSGTSGAAKAVLLTRDNLVACAREVVEAQRLSSADRVLSPLSMAHVNAPVISLLATVISGGSVVLLASFRADEFWRLVDEHSVTWANLAPPLIWALARRPGASLPFARGSLRFVRTASAPNPTPTLARFEASFGVAAVESYGISEASSQVTINDVPPGRRIHGSVGTPRGVSLRLLDERGRDVPPGQNGEVLVSGPTVMAGYLGDPEGTRAVLNAGWLRTGDIGNMDAQGALYLVGRRTELINRGGEKIAPRAVEDVLLGYPDIADVAVVGVPDATYGQEVKAVVVADAGTHLSERDILSFAAQRLPIHWRPRSVQFVPNIPRNGSGKILRAQLI